jgi:hypothetical protein
MMLGQSKAEDGALDRYMSHRSAWVRETILLLPQLLAKSFHSSPGLCREQMKISPPAVGREWLGLAI